MRVVFIGASPVAVLASKTLLEDGHEVVIVEQNQEKIDLVSDEIDCGFINDDGSRPEVLKDISPLNTDILFCLTNNDQSNILSSLIGNSLEFGRVVTKVENPEFQHICEELGLTDLIIPDRVTANALIDMVKGKSSVDLEMSATIAGGLRFNNMVLDHAIDDVSDLKLPGTAKVIAINRQEESIIAIDGQTQLNEGDELVIILNEEDEEELHTLFNKEDN